MNISSIVTSWPARVRRRPFLALGALVAAIGCVAALTAGASALGGDGPAADLGPGIRVGDTGHHDPDPDRDSDRDSDRGDDPDHDGVGERDDDRVADGDDVTTPVTPGSLPADSEEDSDHDDHHESGQDGHDTRGDADGERD